MSLLKNVLRPLPAAVLAVVLALVLVIGFGGPDGQVDDAVAASGGAEMSITIVDGNGGFCVGSACTAGAGASFTLSIDIDSAPVDDYILMQTFISFGTYDPTASEDGAGANTCSDSIDNGDEDGRDRWDSDCVISDLTYNQAPAVGDEILWPDLGPAFWADGTGYVYHGGLSYLLGDSDFEGTVVEFEMSCPATPVLTTIDLLAEGDAFAGTSGALFVEPDYMQVVPKVNSITVNCVAAQTHPGDTDGDGCSDADEAGSNPDDGGDRDWLNPWDFYDVNGDRVIDLANDILGVILHVGSAPGPPYDVQYDRGPWTGANSWNGTTAPDGVIDSPNDVSGVLAQFGDNCN